MCAADAAVARVMINKDEVLELLEEALERLPDELRQARWLLKEREEFLAHPARRRRHPRSGPGAGGAMVQRTEIVREAQHTRQRTVDEATEEARRLRHEAEDYCDQKLAQFEIVLERTLKTVQAGREKLQVDAAARRPKATSPVARRGRSTSSTKTLDQVS